MKLMSTDITDIKFSRKKLHAISNKMGSNILQLTYSRKKLIKNVCLIEKCSKYSTGGTLLTLFFETLEKQLCKAENRVIGGVI
jgi:hypothetical protein